MQPTTAINLWYISPRDRSYGNTADCKSLATCKLNSGKPQLCLNREEGHAEAGKIIRFIHSKSIVVFHCSLACCKTFAMASDRGPYTH